MIENLHIAVQAAESDREDRALNATEQAFDSLEREMRCALLGNVNASIRTPGFGDNAGGKRSMPADDVVYDMLAGIGCEPIFDKLLTICGRFAKSGDEEAMKLIDDIARKHAEFHCDDLAGDQE